MSWIYTNKSLIRKMILILFILSLVGPWVFDLINVPAQYPCNKPFIRLYGDFCGYPMSGFQALFTIMGGLFNILAEWIRGNSSGREREFMALLYAFVIILPFFSVFLSIWKKEARQWRTINLIICGLACIPALHFMFLLSHSRNQLFHVGGLWLYIVVAISAVIFEFFVSRSGTVPDREENQ